MFKILTLFLLLINSVYGLSVSSDDKYSVYESKNYTIVFSDNYVNEASFIKENLDEFLLQFNKSFGYIFDQPLRLVLVSNNIQMPNAFSTQIPYNLGIYFNGGSGMSDYFSNRSWLETLLVHEMVHNYQINAKKSQISQTLHTYLGNNHMPIMASFVPLFTLPNLLLPTVLLEGNSMLNETLYTNGGRLYNGSLNAMKNTLIFNDKINENRLINDHIDFPYTTEKYIVGGYYVKYLTIKYGLNKVNRFFYNHSIHSINPFLLNKSFLENFGVTFEKSIKEFVVYTKNKYKSFKEINGEEMMGSNSEIYFSDLGNQIAFITSDLKTNKTLNFLDKKTQKIFSTSTNLANGPLYLYDGKYYTASSGFISSKLYKYGLFDENGLIHKNTIGKDLKGVYKNKIAYIDISSSFHRSKLFLNEKFYDEDIKSVRFDKDGNLFTFRQEKSSLVLSKNKEDIFSFEGYFVKFTNIFDGDVYFIANSENGSTLYKYSDNKLFRLSEADNINSGIIIDKNKALVSTITHEGYKVFKIDLDPVEVDFPYIYENLPQNEFEFNDSYSRIPFENVKKYNELKEIQFSMLYPYYTYDYQNGSSYMLNGAFLDPIMFNMINLYVYDNTEDKIVGSTYTNERYIPFTLDLYKIDKNIKASNARDFGGSIEVYGPLMKKGREIFEGSLLYYFADEQIKKNVAVVDLDYTYTQQYPFSQLPSFEYQIGLLLKNDRSDNYYGINGSITKDIWKQSYLNLSGKIVRSDVDRLGDNRGIKVENELVLQKDKTDIIIEGLDNSFYSKNASQVSIGFSQEIERGFYFYNFPISIREQLLFYKFNRYKIDLDQKYTINEHIAGVTFDTLFVHKLPLPVTVKYIKNDTSMDDYKVKVELGMSF